MIKITSSARLIYISRSLSYRFSSGVHQRMASAGAPRLDLIIFGASGFTGKYAILEVNKLAKEKGDLKWGISGRNQRKLEDVLKEMGQKAKVDLSKTPIIVADVNNDESLEAMASQARVVINCAGPYRFFGEAVVKACVKSGTHHVDVSGEPQYMERMQLEYHKAAEAKGVYIVSACGFDSIPADLGTVYFVNKFGGDVNSVETYLESSVNEGIKPKGAAIHYGTWESAVYGLAHENELKPLRSKLFPNRLPLMTPKLKSRPVLHQSEYVQGWSLPFPGSDRSVVMRSQRHFFENEKQRPVQMLAYVALPSLGAAIGVVLVAAVFLVLSKFSFGRKILLKYPSIFSGGFISHEGPTEELMENTKFSMTFYCEGWKDKLAEPTDKHQTKPDKSLIGKVTGTNPGYGATCTALVLAAITILKESNKMPSKGGVYPPGAAFAKTSLVDELNTHGVTFKVISTGDVQ